MVETRRTRPCGDCRGTGEIVERRWGEYETDTVLPCTACRGSGLLPARRVILRSGVDVDFLNFDNTELREVDLYRGCIGERRFLHAIDISLALHLSLCASIALWRLHSNRIIAACAAHDLHEVYFRDLPTGLKDLLPDYRGLEARAEASVFRRLHLDDMTEEEKALVKGIDIDACLAEATWWEHPGLAVIEAEAGRLANSADLSLLRGLVSMSVAVHWRTIREAITGHTTDGIIWAKTTQRAWGRA